MHDVNFIDETLDFNNTLSYELSIQAYLDGFSFCVFDIVRSKYIAFNHHSIDPQLPYGDYLNKISDIINVHEKDFFLQDYKKVKCIFNTSRYTLVPEDMFSPDDAHEYLKFSQYIGDLDEIHYTHIAPLKAYIVYPISSPLANLFINKYQSVSFYCQQYPQILFSSQNQYIEKDKVFININNGHLDIIVYKDNKLQLINSFPMSNQNDLNYYILYIFEQLGLNQEHIPVYLSGKLSEENKLSTELKKYIKTVKTVKPDPNISLSYQINKLPFHTIANLLNSHLCE